VPLDGYNVAVLAQRTFLLRAVGLVAVAVAGAALALVGAAAFGRLGERTTIQQVAPLPGGGVGSVSLGSPAGRLSVEEIYRRDAPGVVQITAMSGTNEQVDPFDIFPTTPTQPEQALGSGFVIDKEGHVITNYHVVEGADTVQVSFSDNDQLNARLVGSDASTDIAVLKVDAHSRSLTALPLGDSDKVTVGDPVVAIGNPFGYTRTATAGIVSAVQRTIETPNTVQIQHAIQTDAAINHGNSGGPLIDANARVIGVNAVISTGGTGEQGNVGIGFAIPVNTVKTVAAQILSNGRAQHAYLGLKAKAITPELLKLFNLPVDHGLLVHDVTTGTGAAKAGLQAGTSAVIVEGESYQLGGDIIVGADGERVASLEKLRDLIAKKKPGDKLNLQIYRDGKKKAVAVTLDG
jgi:S1-C subfamily serine protease